jgi:nucleotide-binding universal stress UspA family protein
MNIVVAFNDSPDARTAVSWAAEVARHAGGAVHLVYAVPAPAIPFGASAHAVEDLMAFATARATTMVESAAAELKGQGVNAVIHVKRWLVVDTVITTAREVGAGLVVVGRRGSTRATELLIGTVSSEIVRLSPVSTLVARSGEIAGKPGSILVGVDGSAPSIKALQVAKAVFPDSPLVACNVHHGQSPDPTATIDDAIAAAKIDQKLVTARTLEGDPAVHLLSELEKPEYKACALGPRGLGMLKGLLLGSVSEKVLQLAKKAVLIAR